MKKKLTAALVLALCFVLFAACAMGEITVTKKDMNLNRSLDKNVTNILMIMQNGDKTDTLLIASVNGRTGRSVMTQIPCGITVNVPEAGDVTLGEVYALGAKKSRGLLVARTVNALLDLNASTYVAMDISRFPELIDNVVDVRSPMEIAASAARKEFCEKYGEWGEKLLTDEEKAEAKKNGSCPVYLPHQMPEYKEICELHSEEERKLNAYRERCKNEALELFSKWFYSLGF